MEIPTIIENDEAKNFFNLKKHHISILELAAIFNNPFITSDIDIPDQKHSQNPLHCVHRPRRCNKADQSKTGSKA